MTQFGVHSCSYVYANFKYIFLSSNVHTAVMFSRVSLDMHLILLGLDTFVFNLILLTTIFWDTISENYFCALFVWGLLIILKLKYPSAYGKCICIFHHIKQIHNHIKNASIDEML